VVAAVGWLGLAAEPSSPAYASCTVSKKSVECILETAQALGLSGTSSSDAGTRSADSQSRRAYVDNRVLECWSKFNAH
jgi:hypothetical protein